jgi:hypothetical protein
MRLLFISFILPLAIHAQQKQVVLSMPEHNILYRSYPHQMAVGTINGDTNYRIVVEGGTFEKETSGNVIITPWKHPLKVIFLDANMQDTINTVQFDVEALPPPNVYLGGKKDGESIIKNVSFIHVKYGAEYPFVGVSFEVSGWTLIAYGREVSGLGTELHSEASALLKTCSGRNVTLVVTYIKPDKTITKGSATFYVH